MVNDIITVLAMLAFFLLLGILGVANSQTPTHVVTDSIGSIPIRSYYIYDNAAHEGTQHINGIERTIKKLKTTTP